MEEIKKKINIYLLSGEKIYTIQRKHVISIAPPLVSCILIMFATIIAFILLYRVFSIVNPLFTIDIVLLAVSLSAALGMFIIMNWFYQFYIITNKRLLYIHFFRVRGQHVEEVFIEAGTEMKINRAANNLIYDILNLEDVHIEFRHNDLLEPYTIQTPAHPEELERMLDQVAASHDKGK
jgi:hypothetical protein